MTFPQHPIQKAILAGFALSLWTGTQPVLGQTPPDWAAPAGGRERIEAISGLTWQAVGQRFEPDQTVNAGSKSRHVNDYRVTGDWRPEAQRARLAWEVDIHYPFPQEWSYVEHIAGPHGTLRGRDGFRPSPEGALAPARVEARAKRMWMDHPLLLLAFATRDSELVPAEGGTWSFTHRGTTWTIGFDNTGLPASLWTTEPDPLRGPVINAVRYSDWRSVEGIRFPFRLEQTLDGRLLRRERRETLALGHVELASVAASGSEEDDAMRRRGKEMSHFFLRRIAMGAQADRDEAREARLERLAEGVYHVVGSSHHNLVVEQAKGLVVVDAPYYPRRSEVVLAAIRERWPEKDITHLVLTHHHTDHTGGIGLYASRGVRILLGAPNVAFMREMLERQGVADAHLVPVEDSVVIPGSRHIEVHDVPNSHAHGSLLVFVPDAQLAFLTDLVSPGRPTQPPLWSQEFADAVRFLNLDVQIVAGGHGHGVETIEALLAKAAE